MLNKFTNMHLKMTKEGPAPTGGGGTDYGALMADVFEAAAKKQYEAAKKKEPAKANKTITQG